ncbi:uncharacterized protein LAJ45_04644 [Morchella importuna]|uniref:uncharacterized protein n=1 Tax=Morchella importuna TaxID=1174673 RepID=UPI001E8E66EE|nr:uncharacterized protein LAJ45_04644 [Morchella importuna]KAH8151439.1 hypothetical protein LAJ45_04644 [Morchella importuna]
MENLRKSEPWSLIPETTNVNQVNVVRRNLYDINYCIASIQRLKDNSIAYATEILSVDKKLKGTLTEPERREFKILRRFYCNNVRVNRLDLVKLRIALKMCHEQQPVIFEAFLKMGTEGMQKKIVEYEEEEEILISYMETLETPLLPEGPIYEKYRALVEDVDNRLTLISACIEELKDELETGKGRKDCERYEMEFGQARQDFILMWLLNRALLFLKITDSV